MQTDMIKCHNYYSDLKHTKRSKCNQKNSGHQLKFNEHRQKASSNKTFHNIHTSEGSQSAT